MRTVGLDTQLNCSVYSLSSSSLSIVRSSAAMSAKRVLRGNAGEEWCTTVEWRMDRVKRDAEEEDDDDDDDSGGGGGFRSVSLR